MLGKVKWADKSCTLFSSVVLTPFNGENTWSIRPRVSLVGSFCSSCGAALHAPEFRRYLRCFVTLLAIRCATDICYWTLVVMEIYVRLYAFDNSRFWMSASSASISSLFQDEIWFSELFLSFISGKGCVSWLAAHSRDVNPATLCVECLSVSAGQEYSSILYVTQSGLNSRCSSDSATTLVSSGGAFTEHQVDKYA